MFYNVGLLELDENPTVVAVCVSPAFLEPGSKTLRVVVTNKNGTLKYDIGTRFYAGIYEQNYSLVAIICKLFIVIKCIIIIIIYVKYMQYFTLKHFSYV